MKKTTTTNVNTTEVNTMATVNQLMADTGITLKEIMVMLCVPSEDFYEQGFESTLWADVFCDAVKRITGLNAKATGGVITSLGAKGFMSTGYDEDKEAGIFSLKDKAIELFKALKNVGAAPDEKGYFTVAEQKVLEDIAKTIAKSLRAQIQSKKQAEQKPTEKVEAPVEATEEKPVEETKPEPKQEPKKTSKSKKPVAKTQVIPELEEGTVLLRAFTGMIIGVFPIAKTTKKYIQIKTNTKELKFDVITLKQLDANNPKFANKIELAK